MGECLTFVPERNTWLSDCQVCGSLDEQVSLTCSGHHVVFSNKIKCFSLSLHLGVQICTGEMLGKSEKLLVWGVGVR